MLTLLSCSGGTPRIQTWSSVYIPFTTPHPIPIPRILIYTIPYHTSCPRYTGGAGAIPPPAPWHHGTAPVPWCRCHTMVWCHAGVRRHAGGYGGWTRRVRRLGPSANPMDQESWSIGQAAMWPRRLGPWSIGQARLGGLGLGSRKEFCRRGQDRDQAASDGIFLAMFRQLLEGAGRSPISPEQDGMVSGRDGRMDGMVSDITRW